MVKTFLKFYKQMSNLIYRFQHRDQDNQDGLNYKKGLLSRHLINLEYLKHRFSDKILQQALFLEKV